MMDLPPDMQLPPGSPFEQFFHDFMDKQQKGGAHKHKATALGSGFIIDPNGYIVTNNHVIEDADEITVILQDDTNLTATLVGRDKKTDLALLKVVTKKPLPSVVWGDSDKARVGDWIMAIGDPYGLGGTVTAGILSALTMNIYKRTRRLIAAIPVGPCSIWTAKLSALTRLFSHRRAGRLVLVLPFRHRSRKTLSINCATTAISAAAGSAFAFRL
jgi:hypothetical protein